MPLSAGDIAFVGFNADGNDNIAFVTLVDINVGEVIIFEDNEWNGTAFGDTNEGAFSWTATNVVPAGTIVRIDNIGTDTIAASTGTATTPVTGRGSNRGISTSDETIYAYQGTAASPTFITAIANGGFSSSNGVLDNTGLTVGVNAIDLSTVDDDVDIAAYNGSRSGQASFASYLPLINNPANWITQDATNDQSNDNIAPDVPFSGDAFVVASGGNPSVNISVSSNSGSEANTTAITVTATSSSAVSGDQTVNLAVTGTNITPSDYSLSSATITILNGQTTGTATFTIVDDTQAEGSETAILSINNPSSGISLGTTTSQNITITDNDTAPATRIRDIQGTAHRSPLVGQTVNNVQGVVTSVAARGFYIQDPNPDSNNGTSEGIFVFTSSAPGVTVGQSVEVTGRVDEFRPGNNAGNLTTTQINASVSGAVVTQLVTSLGTITPTVIGTGGRIPPNAVIQNDFTTTNQGNVETGGDFDPVTEGIDFYESLEGMLVQINNPVTISPTNNFGEIWILPDNGANATGRTTRGGSLISPTDFNPERIQIDDTLFASGTSPLVNVGATLNTISGVVDYSFNNYEVLPTSLTLNSPGSLNKETTNLAGDSNNLTVATFNVENLDPGDGDTQFNNIANRILNNLKAPDIISLEEIQDNNGATNDAVVDANQTYQKLIDAITSAGGPTYEYRQINPVDDQDGGEPGGNIRVGFLYNPRRVSFVERSGGGSTTNTTITNASGKPQLSASPGRIDPNNPAFNASRKPLVGEFIFKGETVFVIGNHFNSKGGDQALFGPNQPPTLSSETQRLQQAQIVNDFVDNILAVDPKTNIIVLGDLNDFEFSEPLNVLKGIPGGTGTPVLNNLLDTIPANERYTYNFQGNAQVLDHILVSNNLASKLNGYDVVHINSEFADQDSDHDPSVAQFNFAATGTQTFTLQLLHAADQEAGVPALDDAPRFSAVLNALKNQDANNDGKVDYDNTIILSSGDAYIPSPFLNAAEDPSLAPLLGKEGRGRADIVIQNELGFQAIAFGNHEFDLGTPFVRSLIASDGAYPGAKFPYLSSNLNFATDSNLSSLVTTDSQEASSIPNKIAKSTVITVNGEKIGVVGATTPTLRAISSPGSVGVLPANPNDIDALAAEIQKSVDALKAQGINKIVLLAHMQQIAIEQQLAGKLRDVDIIMAGGSNTRLVDSTDRLRAGDTKQGDYPILAKSATGDDVAIINTDGNYKYVGRLVVDFDAQGKIIPASINPNVSGAYAADDQGVAALNAQNLVDPEIKAITDALRKVIAQKDGNVFGNSKEFLNGTRADIRSEETNLGNLSADANLDYAKKLDPTVIVSLKNGGGVRDNIGTIFAPTGSTEVVKLPTQANPLSGKPEGGISQLDIENALRFNNALTLVTVTAEQLKQVLEHGVAATAPGATPGRFPQIGGVSFSFDASKPAGQRIQNAAILNNDGTLKEVLVNNGQLQGNKDRGIRIVTLGFLADGGDSYPFANFIQANPTFANRVDLIGEKDKDLNLNGRIDGPIDAAKFDSGKASFAASGTEQDAFAEFLVANFANSPFNSADTAPALDTRIQSLNARQDGVFVKTTIEQATTAGVVNLKGGAGFNQLRFTVNRNNPNAAVNELVVFETDGSNNVNLVNLKQLLESGKARVISSVVSNRPNGFTGETPRTLGFAPGAKLGFALIKNGTADQVRAGANKEIIFSTANNFVSNVTGSAFDLAVEGLNVKVEAVNDTRALGTGLQTGAEGELIDLRELTGKVEANFSVYREAAFNNQVYFYKVDNADGFLGSLNPDTANSSDYLNAALNNLVKGADGKAVKLEVANQGSSTIKATVDAGSIIAPLMVVNGSLEQLQDTNPNNNPAVFFPFIGANTGKFDQIRLLGDNNFGFEDIVGGGDADYNDVIVKINLTPVV